VSTLSTARATLAAALSAEADTTGFPYRPPAPKTGDAWPILESLERGPASAFMIHWVIRIMLPADEIKASQWIDDHLDLLYDALHSVAYVEGFRPIVLPASGNDQFALEITVRSE
jgi:hypothetical protein